MGLPDGVGARVVGVGGDGVLVGGRGPMRDARHALDAPHGFLVRRQVHARGDDDRRQLANCKRPEQDEVQRLRQQRPHAKQRDDEEEAGHAQDEPQPRPQPLEVERPAARGHLARELGVQRGGGILRLDHQIKIPGFTVRGLAGRRPAPIKLSTDVHHKLRGQSQQFKGTANQLVGSRGLRTSRHPLSYFEVGRVTAGWRDRSPCSPSDSNRDLPTL